MAAAGRKAVKRGRNARGRKYGGDEDDGEPMGPISPSARRNARRAGAVSEGSAGHSSTAVELRSAKLWVSGGGGSVGVVKGRAERA